jgi:voltage-gated potassium channel Kch
VLEYPELSSQAFTDADVQSARALAVVWQDDVGNLHAGLRAQELNPGLRLVLAIFNGRLGDHIRMLFPDCTVLSGTAMSAPSFVAAALDQPAPSHVRVQRRTLYVARPASGHIIVVGLGNAGTAVTGQLHDLGFDVVCVDNNPNAPGIPVARQLGLPVVIGDAFREQTLRAAHLDTCLALVSVTSLDIVNLETALTARALRDDLRIVLRLTDDDLAERLEKTTGNTISRSVPYLAAPAFATAMLEHQVLRTIDVGRHVLLIAEIRVADQAGLAGSLISGTEQDGQARVLALQANGAAALDWSPQRGYLLAVGDRRSADRAGHPAGPGPVPVGALSLPRPGQALILMTCQAPPMPLPVTWPGALSPR